jgi:hypothetical protein
MLAARKPLGAPWEGRFAKCLAEGGGAEEGGGVGEEGVGGEVGEEGRGGLLGMSAGRT